MEVIFSTVFEIDREREREYIYFFIIISLFIGFLTMSKGFWNEI